jgi:Ca2+-dependent lipid-binding protein
LNKLESLYARRTTLEDDLNFIDVRNRHLHHQGQGT